MVLRAELQDFYINIIFFISIWIIADKTPKRKLFALRAALCFVVFCVVRYVIFHVCIAALPQPARRWTQMIGFALLMGMATGTTLVCYECDVWTALFCGSTSYLMQNICQRLYSIFTRLFFTQSNNLLYSLVMIGVMALVLGVLFFLIKKLSLGKIVVDNKYLLAIVLLIIATAVVLDLISLWAVTLGARAMRFCVWVYSVVISSLIFALLLSLVSGRRTRMERDAIKSILREEREQYRFEKSMIDKVNIACHDLKHQISRENGGMSDELKEKLRDVVDGYDSRFDTGNTALDVILTRKNFRCKESGIELTCAVNGESLSFMSEVDVYSLFGNILDNAIEASEKLDDREKRVVSLSLEKRDYFIYVHAENYFSGKISFSGGLPRTTKSDGGLHGYGIKSIRMLVDKYGGSTKIDTKEDRFMLDLMFPV